VSIFVFVLATIVPLYIVFRSQKIFRGHRIKSFIASLVGIWTALYAGLVPVGTYLIDIQDLNYRGFFEVSSVLLVISYSIHIYLLKMIKVRDIDFAQIGFRNSFIFLLLSALFALAAPNIFLSPYLRSLVILPGAALLYTLSATSAKRLASVAFHALAFFVAFQAGTIIDSKEALVVFLVGPILFAHIFHNRGIRVKNLFFAIILSIVGGFLFIVAQPLVTLSRAGNHIDLIQVISSVPDNFQQISEISLDRAFVLDALARTVNNEFSVTPNRPSHPAWTLTGWIFSITPELFTRPAHAREALFLTGYVTSTTEVNIAVTYLGSLLWSYSIAGLLPSLFLFWMFFLIFLQFGCRLGSNAALLFVFSSGFSILRLERLADVVLSSVFMGLVLSVIIFFLQQSLAAFSKCR